MSLVETLPSQKCPQCGGTGGNAGDFLLANIENINGGKTSRSFAVNVGGSGGTGAVGGGVSCRAPKIDRVPVLLDLRWGEAFLVGVEREATRDLLTIRPNPEEPDEVVEKAVSELA